jgi:hypothetical protein
MHTFRICAFSPLLPSHPSGWIWKINFKKHKKVNGTVLTRMPSGFVFVVCCLPFVFVFVLYLGSLSLSWFYVIVFALCLCLCPCLCHSPNFVNPMHNASTSASTHTHTHTEVSLSQWQDDMEKKDIERWSLCSWILFPPLIVLPFPCSSKLILNLTLTLPPNPNPKQNST